MKKNYIKEVDLVRGIACLCVVLLHSINFTAGGDIHAAVNTIDKWLVSLSSLLSFGTTTFIFISSLLLAQAYPDKLPKGFYLKRFKYIFIPFVFTCFVFALYTGFIGNLFDTPKYFLKNLLGYQHWFVLVVLQFYLLYPVLNKLFQKFTAVQVLLTTLILNVLYLAVFNFLAPPTNTGIVDYIWRQGYWIPFVGWIFYFAVAYYAGRNYQKYISFLNNNKKWIFVLLPLSILLSIVFNNIDTIGFGSKRIDMIPFSVIMIFILFVIAKRVKLSRTLLLISRYSFGIYLLHYLFLILLNNVFMEYDLYSVFGYFTILIMFIVSIALSITMIYTVNRFKYGGYLFGKVKSALPKRGNYPKSNSGFSKSEQTLQ